MPIPSNTSVYEWEGRRSRAPLAEHAVINLQREGVVTKLRLKPFPLRVAGSRRHLPAVQSDSPKDTLWGRGVSFGHP
jgi:hypothetical protein